MVEVIPKIIGCLGGGMKKLKENIRQIFNTMKMIKN